jgi:hypothetical protein
MDKLVYWKNRQQFPIKELRRYRGSWVAFSSDGTRIVATHADPLVLVQIVVELGLDPTEVPVEPVPLEVDESSTPEV